MREIRIKDVGDTLRELLLEQDPIDEDVGIFDGNGEVVGVVIPKKEHEFFLKKVEEEEDRVDYQSIEEFDNSGEKDACKKYSIRFEGYTRDFQEKTRTNEIG